MAERNVPIIGFDGKEYMMSPAEAKAYYNGLPRTDEAAGIFPIGRFTQLAKNSPKAAEALSAWYKGLKNNKWGTKIFDGVSNMHLPSKVNKVGVPKNARKVIPSTVGKAASGSAKGFSTNAANLPMNVYNGGLGLSNKTKAMLATMGATGTTAMLSPGIDAMLANGDNVFTRENLPSVNPYDNNSNNDMYTETFAPPKAPIETGLVNEAGDLTDAEWNSQPGMPNSPMQKAIAAVNKRRPAKRKVVKSTRTRRIDDMDKLARGRKSDILAIRDKMMKGPHQKVMRPKLSAYNLMDATDDGDYGIFY